MLNEQQIERFNSKVQEAPNGCHEWTGATNHKGYGKLTLQRRTVSAHRLAYEHFVGPVPDGMNVCHHCDNPKCVRPDHLFVGTSRDNSVDMVTKGRHFNSRKTHCPKGHEYTYFYKGERQCRACQRERDRARRAS